MKEVGNVSSKQATDSKETSTCNTPSTIRVTTTVTSVDKTVVPCVFYSGRKHRGLKSSKRQKYHKNYVEKFGCFDISDCESVIHLPRTSLSTSSSGSNLSFSETDSSYKGISLKTIKNDEERFDVPEINDLEVEEYERCQKAVVYLTDIFKDTQKPLKGINLNFSEFRNCIEMKPGGSRSPKRRSPMRSNMAAQIAKDSVAVKKIYVKPNSQEPVLDKKTLSDSTSKNKKLPDSTLESESHIPYTPKQKKKSTVKVESIVKTLIIHEQKKTQKKRSPTIHDVSTQPAINNEKSTKGKTGIGHGDSSINVKTDQGGEKSNTESATENTGTPKRRGRKPKSTESSPVKEKRLKSPESKDGTNSNSVSPGISPTRGKDSKTNPKSPQAKRKKEENENPLDITQQIDERLENETISPKAKARGASESPSPVRRKKSPKKAQQEKESPKAGSVQRSNKAKLSNETDLDKSSDMQTVRNSVDEAIDAVVNENIAMLNKADANKSPRNSKEKCQDKKSPSKDKKECPKGKPSAKSQGKESSSPEKKKPRSRSNSTSHKKDKKKTDTNLRATDEEKSPKKKLNFDEDITTLIKERSKLPYPSDFQYKYTSSGHKPGLIGLNDLISKVNSSVKDSDNTLTEMFGKTEEPDYDSDHKLVSLASRDVNTSTDSDKTIIEFGDLSENLNTNDDSKESTSEIIESVEEETIQKCVKSDLMENGHLGNVGQDEMPKLCENEKYQFEMRSDSEIEADNENGIKELSKETESLSGQDVTDIDNQCKDGDSEGKYDHTGSIETDEGEQNSISTVSVFEMFGLKLRKPRTNEVAKPDKCESSMEQILCEKDSTEKKAETLSDEAKEKSKEEDDDVMFVSETKPEGSIVILSDDDETESKPIDRSGYESLIESNDGKVRPKFTTVNNVVDPKPLDVLHNLEKAEITKKNAFACSELEDYLDLNKENMGPSYMTPCKQDFESFSKEKKLDIKEELKKVEPDFDEIDGYIFVSFATENAMKAHVSLEKKMDWLTECQLKKIAHLKQMKERQNDSGSRRITDVKSVDEQKQNFRGTPMRWMKYQKMMKQELEDILLGRQSSSVEKSPSKTPTKTTDITKIKGWKNKFQNAEELQEATGLNISESGKVHWKTEERLVKNLDPEDIKDIGLDLKKKRRKLVNYNSKKKGGHKSDGKDSELMDYEYEIDELAVIESDVFNEDEGKPPPEKIPYSVKYSSQHKYGMRKLFVKRMKLDAEDERILQKLGTQKHIGQTQEALNSSVGRKKGKQIFALNKLTHNMAVAAVSALDKTLLRKAISMEKAEIARNKKKDKQSGKKGGKVVEESDPEDIEDIEEEGDEEEEEEDNDEDYDDGSGEEEVDESKDTMEEEEDKKAEEPDTDGEQTVRRTRRHSTASRGVQDTQKSSNKDNVSSRGEGKVQPKTEPPDACTEPGPISTSSRSLSTDRCRGCRYGCICHLCKLSDSGEEKEPDFKPPCDKEYCRLGCICESIDTETSETHHCRKPACMLECKCPPKQPKPDIPRERERSRKKKGRGGKKKKRTPEKKECEEYGKEEDAFQDDNEWEPPSKRKRGTANSRFANLPKRETTYRLAKNLDAVSRKAMEVYASSEMFTEQIRVRRRRSDQGYEDGSMIPLDERSKSRLEEISNPRLNEMTGVLEISDDDDDDDDGEVYPEGLVSCARTVPYEGPYKQKKAASQLNKRKGGPSSSQRTPKTVIDLVDSDKEDNSGDTKDKSDGPSTSSNEGRPQSLTEKMGLTNKIAAVKNENAQQGSEKWKTQMVCLKAKKKSDDKPQDSEAEIKLLEIMANCNWEIDRTNMLSKISHIISKGSVGCGQKSMFVNWGAYILEFLPKAKKPAVIPPELKSKLPTEMFSIRIRVTKNDSKVGKKEKTAKETIVVEDKEIVCKHKVLTEEEKKKYNMKLQKKLIEKIKFAEKFRNLIIAEEQKGITPSKFSVSREGIEKALKKYKTQLWKAYTGTGDFTIQQFKQALQAAKSATVAQTETTGTSKSDAMVSTTSSANLLSPSTATRIQSNQGVTVKTHIANPGLNSSFINLANLQGNHFQTVGNLVIHNALPASGYFPAQGQGFIENIENVKNIDAPPKIATGQTWKVPTGNGNIQIQGTSVSSAATNAFMPSNLPQGAKFAVIQTVPNCDGSPVTLPTGQPPVASGPVRFNPVCLPQNSSLPFKTMFNPTVVSISSIRPVHSQGSNVTAGTSLLGPQTTSLLKGLASTASTTVSGVIVNRTNASAAASFPATFSIPNSSGYVTSTGGMLPLKNISNLGIETIPGSSATAIRPTMSPSIYPIKFASNPSGKMHAVPSNDMIGVPKLASVPIKVVQDGNQMLFVPVTSTVSSGGPAYSGNLAANSIVSLNCVTQASIGTPMVAPRLNSPIIFAESTQSSVTVHNHIPTINSTVERKICATSNKEQSESTNREDKSLPKLEPEVSVTENAQEDKTHKVTAEVDNGSVVNSENCDSVTIDSDDNCDIPSSTRSLSSLGDMIKADLNGVELNIGSVNEKIEEKSVKVKVCRSEVEESDEVIDILESSRNAGNETDKKEKDNTENEKSDTNTGAEVEKLEIDESSKESISKADSECVVITDTDDECGLKKESDNHQDNEATVKVERDIKRERNEMENEVDRIQEHVENRSENKEKNNSYMYETEKDAIQIEDSEDSDVDVTSYEAVESMSYMVPGGGWSGQQATGQNKRKSQHRVNLDDDDFQIKKLKIETTKDMNLLPETLRYRDKYRRLQLRNLFNIMERTLFKYNSLMQSYRGKVPKHMILQEALRLLEALKRREEELKECLDDGKQYKQSLQAELKLQIDSFVESGVPECIIKNFLKSVGSSFYPPRSKRKKESKSSTSELIEISDDEESDTTLEYDPLTPAKVQENWTKLVDDHLCSFDGDPIRAPFKSKCSKPVISAKAFNIEKNKDVIVTWVSKPSVQTETLSGSGSESKQVVSNYDNAPEKETDNNVAEPDTIDSDSPVLNEQSVERTLSPSNAATPGQKSSSDDDEVRSSTGDIVMDHDGDYPRTDLWDEVDDGESVLQKDVNSAMVV